MRGRSKSKDRSAGVSAANSTAEGRAALTIAGQFSRPPLQQPHQRSRSEGRYPAIAELSTPLDRREIQLPPRMTHF
jgi:hypothetical protein